jgi:hypothetical protein
LTACAAQIKTELHHRMSNEFGRSARRIPARPVARLFGQSMHFSFYLMITALVILGAEVAYALYQLVNLTL